MDDTTKARLKALMEEIERVGPRKMTSIDKTVIFLGLTLSQTIAITGRSYRLKDHATIAGKEDKNKRAKSKSNETSTAEPAS